MQITLKLASFIYATRSVLEIGGETLKLSSLNRISSFHRHRKLVLLWVGVFIIQYLTGKFDAYFYSVFPTVPFLHYHILLEFISIIFYFVMFTTTFYTFYKTKRTRLLVFSATFFVIGWLDFFHTMTYNGMQGFFAESSIQRATTYWVLSRMLQGLGLLTAALIPHNRKTQKDAKYLVIGSVLLCGLCFYLVSYRIHVFPIYFVEGAGLSKAKLWSEYFIMFLFAATIVVANRDYQRTQAKEFLYYIAGLSFAIFAEATFSLYRSVYDSYNFLGHIYKIFSAYYMFKGIFFYNLETPYRQLHFAREQIKNYADNLELIVEKRTREIRQVNDKMISDLEYAKEIQRSILPEEYLQFDQVQAVSENIPCERLSGDFYHIRRIDQNHLGMIIADVAGHGVSAAMMGVFTERFLDPVHHAREAGPLPPHQTLIRLYQEFNKASFPDEMHIVVFKAIYHFNTGVLSYCTGGLNTLPIVSRSTGEIEFLDKSIGFPICKVGDFYEPVYQSAEIQLHRGDRVIFYSDGLIEAKRGLSLIDKDQLIQILQDNRHRSLKELKEVIHHQIHTLLKNQEIEDDITYFILEV